MPKKDKKSHSENILWLDIEMTGLSVENDLILEIAAIVTDWDFNEIDTFQGVVKHDEKILAEKFNANSLFWNDNAESRDGLLAQNKSGRSLERVERDIIKFLNKNFDIKKPILCAGNSVHVDRRFIMSNWPKFDAKLHYRMLDVSAWKVVFNGKYKKKFAKMGTHRALDDIRGSIMELQYYLAKIK